MSENNSYFALKVDNDKFKNKTQTETAIPFYAEDDTDPSERDAIWKLYYRHYSTEEEEDLLPADLFFSKVPSEEICQQDHDQAVDEAVVASLGL